jgi:hypothetical protein
VVGVAGFELATPSSRTRCAASHTPLSLVRPRESLGAAVNAAFRAGGALARQTFGRASCVLYTIPGTRRPGPARPGTGPSPAGGSESGGGVVAVPGARCPAPAPSPAPAGRPSRSWWWLRGGGGRVRSAVWFGPGRFGPGGFGSGTGVTGTGTGGGCHRPRAGCWLLGKAVVCGFSAGKSERERTRGVCSLLRGGPAGCGRPGISAPHPPGTGGSAECL